MKQIIKNNYEGKGTMKKKVAITGGIGSGKSTLMQLIKDSGYDVHSCDEIYQDIFKSGEYVAKIKHLFPCAVSNNIIDKKALADIIFQDENAREQLNAIAHPLVMRELENRMNASVGDLVFAEVPLLFEASLENSFDEIIVVMRNQTDRIQAVVDRDKATLEQVRKRIDAQVNYQSKAIQQRIQKCNAFIIYNDGDIAHLKEQWLRFIGK